MGEAPPAKLLVTHTADAPTATACKASIPLIIPRTIMGRPVKALSYLTCSNLK